MSEASKMPLKSSGLGENALKKSASFEALFVVQFTKVFILPGMVGFETLYLF